MNQARYKINKGLTTQKIDNKITIFSGEDSILHTLNVSAAYIFQGLKLGWSDKKIIEGLIEKYDASPQEAKEDFEDFRGLLIKKKILIQSQ